MVEPEKRELGKPTVKHFYIIIKRTRRDTYHKAGFTYR